MEMNVKKKIKVEIQLDNKEIDLLFNAFNLLETIQDKVLEEGLEDKDIFTIYWKNGFNENLPHDKTNDELTELLGRFDDFFI